MRYLSRNSQNSFGLHFREDLCWLKLHSNISQMSSQEKSQLQEKEFVKADTEEPGKPIHATCGGLMGMLDPTQPNEGNEQY